MSTPLTVQEILGMSTPTTLYVGKERKPVSLELHGSIDKEGNTRFAGDEEPEEMGSSVMVVLHEEGDMKKKHFVKSPEIDDATAKELAEEYIRQTGVATPVPETFVELYKSATGGRRRRKTKRVTRKKQKKTRKH